MNGVGDLSGYARKGWTVILLADYFLNLESNQARSILDKKVIPWCQDRLIDGDWEINGVTKFSYRVQFKRSEDALLFKLMFSI